MCIYISPICNVEIRIIFSVEIIKLGILYFSLFTGMIMRSLLNNKFLFF